LKIDRSLACVLIIPLQQPCLPSTNQREKLIFNDYYFGFQLALQRRDDRTARHQGQPNIIQRELQHEMKCPPGKYITKFSSFYSFYFFIWIIGVSNMLPLNEYILQHDK
jgi:hypothetical protein